MNPLVAIIVSSIIGALVGWIALDIITARQDAKDMREQIEEFYKIPNPHFVPPPTKKPIRKRTVTFDKESGDLDIKWEDATDDEISEFHAACVEAMGGNAELTTIRYGLGNEGMILMYNGKQVSPGEYHLLQRNGVGLIPNAHIIAPLKTIDMHEPSCKCAYCGCTNDHIYGTCDYCCAPLSEE